MTVEIFLALLVCFSTATSLLTEAVKKITGEKIPYNMIVLVIAIIVGCVGTGVFYVLKGIPITSIEIIYLLLMGVANWIGAMVGYDKVKQLICQIGSI